MKQDKKKLYELQTKYNERWVKIIKEHLAAKDKIEQDYRNCRQEIADKGKAYKQQIKAEKTNTSKAFSELMRAEFDDYHKRMAAFEQEKQEAFSKFNAEHNEANNN